MAKDLTVTRMGYGAMQLVGPHKSNGKYIIHPNRYEPRDEDLLAFRSLDALNDLKGACPDHDLIIIDSRRWVVADDHADNVRPPTRPILAKRKEHQMTEVATNKAPRLSNDQTNDVLQQFANGFGQLQRSPVLHSPSEQDLDYENVTFPSLDGVTLEGWFIPVAGSDKLIIANHPMGFSRSGQPTQFEPWHSEWASSGNGFEVNFIPDYKILHDAGYNVLTYDLRNHGFSGAANGGIASSGIFEARDVVGSLQYARSRDETRNMTVGLFSRCLGCNATFSAMTQFPEAFNDVRCLVGPQPVTTQIILERQLALAGVPVDHIEDLEQRIVLRTGIGFAPRDPREWAKHVRVPTFLYQVHDDVLTQPSDVQTMFDNIPIVEKKLQWIYGTSARWDGYLEFQRRPQPMLEWFEKYMS